MNQVVKANRKPTIRQRRLAQVIVENSKLDKPLNAGQMLEKVSYGKISKQPSRILESEGVKMALDDLGFTEEAAMKVVTELMNSKEVDPSARLKATDQVFKVRGTYAPERNVNLNLEIPMSDKEQVENSIDLFLKSKNV